MNEDKNNINIGDDPTIPLQEINTSILESEYDKLSSEEKILLACKLIGFDHKPATIRRFICDDYYLGGEGFFNKGKSLFPKWFDVLEDIYPNSITTKYPWISLGGAVNYHCPAAYIRIARNKYN